jgi:predicted ArsR family transcriptional regulator
MIEYLHLHGPSQVGTLAAALDQQVGSISHHLRMLERAGVVAKAPELATDGRTSWWRLVQTEISWSIDDFSTDPATRTQVRAAERLNIDYQLTKLAAWKRAASAAGEAWRRAAFSSDFAASATPEELARLHEALARAWKEWRDAIDVDDGHDRESVFVFFHGFPSAP